LNSQTRIEIGFAAVIIALGLYLLIGSSSINLGFGYDRIGPRFFPYLIAAGLLVTSLIMLVEAWRQRQHSINVEFKTTPLIYIATGLVLCVLTLERLGFIFSVSLLFILIAKSFNSMKSLRDGGVGLILAIVVYFIFTSGLGLVLPKGILSGIM
jgi:putative tricarboxylic transport membrane protein